MMKNNSFGVYSVMSIIIFHSVINFNHVKVRYIEPCNFLTKRAFVRQQSTLVVAKDPDILHYLNLLIYLPTIIFAII